MVIFLCVIIVTSIFFLNVTAAQKLRVGFWRHEIRIYKIRFRPLDFSQTQVLSCKHVYRFARNETFVVKPARDTVFPKIAPDMRHFLIGQHLIIVCLIIESSDVSCPLTFVYAH